MELQKSGMGSEEIYDKAYVPASTQTVIVVAAQVSLRYGTWGTVVKDIADDPRKSIQI